MRPAASLLLAVAVATGLGSGLTACSGGADGESRLGNYLDRLGRTLEAPIDPGPVSALRFPALAPQVVDVSDIGLLDFLALSGCDLQVNLARRNTQLGRHASASQQLLLDLEFLRLAPACIDHLQDRGETELATTLGDATRDRREQLPVRIYNATIGGPEYAALWRWQERLDDYPDATAGDVVAALVALETLVARWLSDDYSVDPAAFELLLSELRGGDGGALLHAGLLQEAYLGAATRALAPTAGDALCPSGRRTERAQVLATVVQKFFVGDVQVWLAAVNQRRHQLLPPITGIEAALATVIPEAYRRWQEQRDRALDALAATPKAHVRALQDLTQNCGGVLTAGG